MRRGDVTVAQQTHVGVQKHHTKVPDASCLIARDETDPIVEDDPNWQARGNLTRNSSNELIQEATGSNAALVAFCIALYKHRSPGWAVPPRSRGAARRDAA